MHELVATLYDHRILEVGMTAYYLSTVWPGPDATTQLTDIAVILTEVRFSHAALKANPSL